MMGVLSLTTFCWEHACAFTLSVFLPGAHVYVVLPGMHTTVYLLQPDTNYCRLFRTHIQIIIFNAYCITVIKTKIKQLVREQ